VLLVACFDINIVVFPKKAMKSYKNISENKHSPPPQFKILWILILLSLLDLKDCSNCLEI